MKSKPLQVDLTVERDGIEIDVMVLCQFTPGQRGARDSLCGKARAGPQLEPDDPDEMEIVDVTDAAGNAFELTNAEEEQAIEKAWDALEPDDPDDDGSPMGETWEDER